MGLDSLLVALEMEVVAFWCVPQQSCVLETLSDATIREQGRETNVHPRTSHVSQSMK